MRKLVLHRFYNIRRYNTFEEKCGHKQLCRIVTIFFTTFKGYCKDVFKQNLERRVSCIMYMSFKLRSPCWYNQ